MSSTAATNRLLVRVLGGVELRPTPDHPWAAPPPQQRVVVALLVARLGQRCSTDRLVHAVWGDQPPPTARRLLQQLVSRIRAGLDADAREGPLVTVPAGWRLELSPEQLDAASFEQLTRRGWELLTRGDRGTARPVLRAAVDLWRGQPFGELGDHPDLVGQRRRLEEELLAAREHLLQTQLLEGQHPQVVAELRALVAAHPFRERLWGLLMEGLCRTGQPAAALDAYGRLRERLVGELGTDPSPQLQELHTAILRHEVPLPAAS